MADIKKIKRAAFVVFGIISLLFLVHFIQMAIGTVASIRQDHSIPHFNWNASIMINTIIGLLIYAMAMIISLSLLFSIRREETPFSRKAVKKLKIVSILLILFEVHNYIAQRIDPWVIFEEADVIGTVTVGWGGFMLASGLVVYCVSLVLEYGISLQTQVDETL